MGRGHRHPRHGHDTGLLLIAWRAGVGDGGRGKKCSWPLTGREHESSWWGKQPSRTEIWAPAVPPASLCTLQGTLSPLCPGETPLNACPVSVSAATFWSSLQCRNVTKIYGILNPRMALCQTKPPKSTRESAAHDSPVFLQSGLISVYLSGQPQCSWEQNEISTVVLTEPWFLFFPPPHMDVIYIHKRGFFFPTVYNFSFFFSFISSHGAFLDKTITIQTSWESVSNEALFLNMYRQRKLFLHRTKSLQSTQTRSCSSSGFLSAQQLGQQLSQRAHRELCNLCLVWI